MAIPTECKYCGCVGTKSKTDSKIRFGCFSTYWISDGKWDISTNCGATCALLAVHFREVLDRLKNLETRGVPYAWLNEYSFALRNISMTGTVTHEIAMAVAVRIAVYEAVQEKAKMVLDEP